MWISIFESQSTSDKTFFSKYFLILLFLSLTTLLLFNLIIFFRHLIILRQRIHIYVLTVKYKNFLLLKLGKAWQNLNALPIFPLYQRCNILLRLQTLMERINCSIKAQEVQKAQKVRDTPNQYSYNNYNFLFNRCKTPNSICCGQP